VGLTPCEPHDFSGFETPPTPSSTDLHFVAHGSGDAILSSEDPASNEAIFPDVEDHIATMASEGRGCGWVEVLQRRGVDMWLTEV
jgi:hypothetical protein